MFGDRCVVNTIVFNDCRSDAIGTDVVGVVFEGRQRGLTFLVIPNDDKLINVNQGGRCLRCSENVWCWWRERCNFAM
jgi:hypothetical protein